MGGASGLTPMDAVKASETGPAPTPLATPPDRARVTGPAHVPPMPPPLHPIHMPQHTACPSPSLVRARGCTASAQTPRSGGNGPPRGIGLAAAAAASHGGQSALANVQAVCTSAGPCGAAPSKGAAANVAIAASEAPAPVSTPPVLAWAAATMWGAAATWAEATPHGLRPRARRGALSVAPPH